MNFNKHNYLGEHRGKANILLTTTIEDEFSIILTDEQDEVKSSWEMTMHKEDAEKVIRKATEMLGVIPKGEWICTTKGDLGINTYKCSLCGHRITFTEVALKHYKGCYCGATMKGDAE